MCDECDKMNESGWCYPFRWRNATISIVACEQHFREVRYVLIEAQKGEKL